MNRKRETHGVLKPIITGFLVSTVLSILLSVLCAYLITGQVIAQEHTVVLARAVSFISVLIGVFAACRKKGREVRWYLAAAICLCYMLVVFLCKFSFFPGSGNQILLNVVLCFAAGLCATLLSGAVKSGHRKVALKRRR